MRTLMINMLYRKILTLDPHKAADSGQVANLIANDTQFIENTLPNFNNGNHLMEK
jgi:hypothetical protein